jgi:hypothetical protein
MTSAIAKGEPQPMTDDAINVFLTFPPRSLADGEREMVRQWFAGTTDIASAYVSERRGDDPAHFRKIVIVEAGSRRPAWLVHCPNGTEVWLVTSQAEGFGPRYYTSLRAALESIRPHQSADPAGQSGWTASGAVADRRTPPLSASRARTIAEMAAALRRPLGGDSAGGAPRRKPT